jgi:5-oxoprolinase (ATP-hydrolysing)
MQMYEKHKESNLNAEDYMDDGSVIKLKISIDIKNKTAEFDFKGTSEMVFGNINAPRAVRFNIELLFSVSAILYCLRCLVNQEIPLNGFLKLNLFKTGIYIINLKSCLRPISKF